MIKVREYITFSADFEMAWAFRYSKNVKNASEMGQRERDNFPQLLSLFNRHKIPVCWATVGHLFLERCENNRTLAHSEMTRPTFFENRNWLFNKGDWYDHDPCTCVDKDPAWYAPDLIERIIDSPIKHEIACHTFSHIDFSYKNCPAELAKSELEECKRLAAIKNIVLKSMVFPGGTVGNFETLKKEGFSSYRKPMKYDVDLPYIDKAGLIAIPSSYALDGEHKFYSVKKYLKMAKSFIDAAVKYNLICHFWFHPSMNPWYLEHVLPEILIYVSKLKSQDKIEILTMNNISEQFFNHD